MQKKPSSCESWASRGILSACGEIPSGDRAAKFRHLETMSASRGTLWRFLETLFPCLDCVFSTTYAKSRGSPLFSMEGSAASPPCFRLKAWDVTAWGEASRRAQPQVRWRGDSSQPCKGVTSPSGRPAVFRPCRPLGMGRSRPGPALADSLQPRPSQDGLSARSRRRPGTGLARP